MTSMSKKSKQRSGSRERERSRERSRSRSRSRSRERERSRERINKRSIPRNKKSDNVKNSMSESDPVSELIKVVKKVNNATDILKVGQTVLCTINDQIRTSLIPWTTEYFQKNHKNFATIYYVSYGNYLVYVPLFMELYYMLFHMLIVRIWLFANFCCSLLYMYDNLNDTNDEKLLWITNKDIKKLASVCVGSGALLLILFANSTGIINTLDVPL